MRTEQLRIRSVVAGAAALALLTGCGTSGGTTGTPTGATPPPSSGAGAPKVRNPLDLKAFEADPCSAFTPAQAEAYGLPGVAGRKNPTSPGPGCDWLGASTPAKASPGLVILPEGTNLESVYGNKDNGTYAVFEPRPDVQGYPAVLTLPVDQRPSGSCTIVVGVSDARAVLFDFQSVKGSSRLADPCGAVTEFANLVLTTMKAGAK